MEGAGGPRDGSLNCSESSRWAASTSRVRVMHLGSPADAKRFDTLWLKPSKRPRGRGQKGMRYVVPRHARC